MSGYLTRSQYTYKGTLWDPTMKMEADVYQCKAPIKMTINNTVGHKNKHGLGGNPGEYVSAQEYDAVFAMRPRAK